MLGPRKTNSKTQQRKTRKMWKTIMSQNFRLYNQEYPKVIRIRFPLQDMPLHTERKHTPTPKGKQEIRMKFREINNTGENSNNSNICTCGRQDSNGKTPERTWLRRKIASSA